MVSSLHVATVETQRYAFLLFSVVLTVTTRVFFDTRVRCLRHAMSCSNRKLLCVKLISCVKFSAFFSKGNSFHLFEKSGFMT